MSVVWPPSLFFICGFMLCSAMCYGTDHFVFVAFLRRIIAPAIELSLKIFFRRSYVLGSLY